MTPEKVYMVSKGSTIVSPRIKFTGRGLFIWRTVPDWPIKVFSCTLPLALADYKNIRKRQNCR